MLRGMDGGTVRADFKDSGEETVGCYFLRLRRLGTTGLRSYYALFWM